MADLGGSMFGSPIGEIAYDTNLRGSIHSLVEGYKGIEEIATAPVERRLKAAHAAKLEEEAAKARGLEQIMQVAAGGAGIQGGVEGRPQTLDGLFDRAAVLAAGRGFVKEAEDLAKTSATLRTRDTRAIANQAAAAVNQQKLIKERAELIAQIFGGATDQASWDQANVNYMAYTGKPSPFAREPFDPEYVKALNQGAISAAKRAELKEKELTREALIDFRNSRLDQHDVENEIRKKNLQIKREREDRLAKGGGGRGVASASREEINQAAAAIKADYPNLTAKDLEDAAYQTASEARALRNANKALSASQALQQAHANAVQGGDYQVGQQSKLLGFEVGKPDVKYQGRGKSPEAPIPTVPEKPAERAVGRYYRSPTGLVAKWTGKGWEPVGRPASTAPVSVRPLSPNNVSIESFVTNEEDSDNDNEDD